MLDILDVIWRGQLPTTKVVDSIDDTDTKVFGTSQQVFIRHKKSTSEQTIGISLTLSLFNVRGGIMSRNKSMIS